MTNANAPESVQAEGGKTEPPSSPTSPGTALHGGNKVYKSGPLFLSSKGIGWTSWKKRWFILTRTSLVFYRSDPNVVPQKGSEVNLTLGGIDLNSSGSVVVKEDKKLITVLFTDGRDGRTDGRDGRAFTLKAETMEDLHGWKEALEEAIASAPSPALVMGPNGSLKKDQSNADDASSDQLKERQIVKSLVIGGPILLALEDIDGTPSFLEKALRFLEEHGVKIEGILRQAADVEDVEHRIQEYEKGKTDFLPEEDPHVIADCIKYVLRELPSSPVPASCCKALLEAFRTDRGIRVNSMREAICETFPEPNRRLLQRILMMMQTVASHKAENRMSVSAVAACMAPLLLRPLLAGDLELENDFSVGGDSSVQLLQAAAAANHAQAIVIILLEEYDNIFGDGAVSHEPYTDSEESGSESEEISDDDYSDEDDESFDDDGDDYTTEASGTDVDEHEPSPISSKSAENHLLKKVLSEKQSREIVNVVEASKNLPASPPQTDNVSNVESNELLGHRNAEISLETICSSRRPTVWGRTPGRKNLSMESVEVSFENGAEIQTLDSIEEDSETRISMEALASLRLHDSIERRKHDLHKLRVALEKDVAKLHEKLEKEMKLRKALEEVGLKISQLPPSVDEKMMDELEELARTEAYVVNLNQKADDLELQLNQQREHNSRILHDIGNKLHQIPDHQLNMKEKQMDDESLPISCASENLPKNKHEPNVEKPHNEIDQKQEKSSSYKQPDVRDDKATVEIAGNKLAKTSSRRSSTTVENLDLKGLSPENGQSLQNVDDKESKSEGQQTKLDRDKGHSKVPPKTNSR